MDTVQDCLEASMLLQRAAMDLEHAQALERAARETSEGLRRNMFAFMRERDSLIAPFRNAEQSDWDHLFEMLPDSGNGNLWRAVMTEAKAALAEIEN